MADEFTTERAGFAERLARLTGGSTWRQPMEGGGSTADMQPEAHRLAQALAYARTGPGDIGPEIVAAVVLGWPASRERVVPELTAALLACAGRAGDRNADWLPIVAGYCWAHVATGVHLPEDSPHKEIAGRDWLLLTGLGCGHLWDACEQTLRRAERAYRSDAG